MYCFCYSVKNTLYIIHCKELAFAFPSVVCGRIWSPQTFQKYKNIFNTLNNNGIRSRYLQKTDGV